jgi:hypothetical protein
MTQELEAALRLDVEALGALQRWTQQQLLTARMQVQQLGVALTEARNERDAALADAAALRQREIDAVVHGGQR